MAVLPGRSPRRATSAATRLDRRPWRTIIGERGRRGRGRRARRRRGRSGRAARQPGPRCERRWKRHGADDRAGAHLQPERHRVRRHPRLHVPRRRGAGAVGACLHAERAVAEHFASTACSTTTSSATTRVATASDGATIRVYSEGPEDSPSRELARFVQRWGGRYVPSHQIRLMARRDRFSRGGDHSAYNEFGFAAVGFRESRENFTRQHDVRDTFEDPPQYLARNARERGIGGRAALAPSAPVVVSERGQPMIGRAAVGMTPFCAGPHRRASGA